MRKDFPKDGYRVLADRYDREGSLKIKRRLMNGTRILLPPRN